MTERQEFKDAAARAAWPEGQDCPTCHGEGRVPGGRKIVHCSMSFTGADWDLDGVLNLIDKAESVEWAEGFMGHDLHVVADGRLHRFQVSAPGSTA